jgi:uncharacterized protein
MPEFSHPFVGMVPERKLTIAELVRTLRIDVAAEEDATHLYMAQADATENALARKVLIDIADEERVHVGEFQRLIQLLTGDEDKWLKDGAAEVDSMAAEVNQPKQEKAAPSGADAPTIGSLKNKKEG